MHFRVFYLINRSGECVSSTSAVSMSAKDICEQMLDRLHSEDDYLGIIDIGDNTLQVLPEPENQRYYVEVPIEAAKASYGRHVDRTELEELIRSLPEAFNEKTIPGLTYRPWSRRLEAYRDKNTPRRNKENTNNAQSRRVPDRQPIRS
ncbi:MAG: hypothetical protein WBG92_21080 [Thiohalocapsa sp.]